MAEDTRPNTLAANPAHAVHGPRRSRRGRSAAASAAPPVIYALLAVGAIALAAAGWFIFQQQEELRRASATLSNADARIGVLEDRLRLTDATLSDTEAQTDEQLNYWESEIRKLWDIGNKRNRGWIETNRANVGKLADNLGAVEADLKTLKGTAASLEAAVQQHQDVADVVTSLDMRVQGLIRQQRDLVDKVNAAAQIASSLQAGLESRVAENEEAIQAFDAQRAQINADIIDLRSRLRTRSSETPTVATPAVQTPTVATPQ